MKYLTTKIENSACLLISKNIKELFIQVKGELDCGNEFVINAKYDANGAMTHFKVYNKGYDTIDFYIQIADVLQKLKNIDNSAIENIIFNIKDIQLKYKENVSEKEKEYSSSSKKLNALKDEINDLNYKYKKSRGKNRAEIEIQLEEKNKEFNDKDNLNSKLKEELYEILGQYSLYIEEIPVLNAVF